MPISARSVHHDPHDQHRNRCLQTQHWSQCLQTQCYQTQCYRNPCPPPRPERHQRPWWTTRGLWLRFAVGLLVSVGFAACASTPSGPSAIAATGGFAAPGAQHLAIYLELTNSGGPDELLGARLAPADAGIASGVSLHRTVERDGLTFMEPAPSMPLPAGGGLILEAGGGHLMVDDLAKPLDVGAYFTVLLEFADHPDVAAQVIIVPMDEVLKRLDGQGHDHH